MITYIFDGSAEGMLSAVFESYERKHRQVKLLCGAHAGTQELFDTPLVIVSDPYKAGRVWEGLKRKIPAGKMRHFINARFAEQPQVWQVMFDYVRYIFDGPAGAAFNTGAMPVLELEQVSKKVDRERHRMKAFIRFQKGGNGMYHAVIRPDYNVLPLIVKHFSDRYADQPWLIYDEQRQYGMYYDTKQVQEVSLGWRPDNLPARPSDICLDEQELLYSRLWKDYFKSTSIKERKNMRLHIQHVPKRYWRYLTEKDGP
jgi:probable DNA metabolism protein